MNEYFNVFTSLSHLYSELFRKEIVHHISLDGEKVLLHFFLPNYSKTFKT